MMRVRLSKVAAVVLVACALCAAVGTVAAQGSAAGRGRARRASRAQSVASARGAQQGQRPTPTQPSPRPETQGAADAEPDLSITARVTAGELLFRKVPNPRVEFTGRPERETVWEAERHNLPAEVQPGVTYRDIGITLRIQSIFPDIERIVAEALGEIPADDPAPPAEPPPAPPAADTRPPAVTPSPATTRRPQSRPRRGRSQ
jgi:hypothetical protein